MDCVFCKIVNKQIPAKIIAENKNAIAFLDVEPMSDGHTIVIPKKHYANLTQCDKQTLHDVMDLVQEVAVLLKDSSLKPWGINYLSNEGNLAGQVVMHFHVHVIPKYGKAEGLKIEVGTKYLGDIDNIYGDLKKTIKKHI